MSQRVILSYVILLSSYYLGNILTLSLLTFWLSVTRFQTLQYSIAATVSRNKMYVFNNNKNSFVYCRFVLFNFVRFTRKLVIVLWLCHQYVFFCTYIIGRYIMIWWLVNHQTFNASATPGHHRETVTVN